MTYEVQQTRWDRIIRRVSGSIGPGSRVAETLSELFPVLDVERVPGELLLLGGTRLAWGGDSRPGVAGNTGKIQLFNPAGSQTILTVTRILYHAQFNGLMRLAMELLPRTTNVATARYRDSRLGNTDPPVGQIRSETTATIVTILNRLWSEDNTQQDIRDENSVAVLAPGAGITMQADAANIQINVTFFWRERPAEESELSL